MDILADTDNSLYLKRDNRYVGQICIYFLRAWLKKKVSSLKATSQTRQHKQPSLNRVRLKIYILLSHYRISP